MACQIKILGVVGQKKSGALVGIKVVGSASNCDIVIVTITCEGSRQQFQAKVIDGAWSVTAPPGDPNGRPCLCDEKIEVAAECLSHQCQDMFTGILPCEDVTTCPDIFVDITPIDADSKCDAGGMRVVSGTVAVSPDPSKPVGVTITLDGSPVASHPATTTAYTLTFSVPLGPGTHVLKVVPSDPGCGSFGQSIKVPACPGTESCPKAEIDHIDESDCRGTKRVAKVFVNVTPQGGPTDVQLLHGSNTIDSATAQVTPFVLSGADTFTPGGDTVTVNVTKPGNCPPLTLNVNVSPCPEGGQPGPGGSNGGDDGDDGSGGCLIGRVLVALLLATALFLTLVGFCVPGSAPAVLIAAAAFAAAGAIAFGLWWLFCGSRCGALLILWQISMIGAWVSAFLASCCPAALLTAIGLGVAALAIFFSWLTACKPSSCKLTSELLWVYVTAIGTIFAYLTKLAPCGLPAVPSLAAVIAAVLAVAVGVACKK